MDKKFRKISKYNLETVYIEFRNIAISDRVIKNMYTKLNNNKIKHTVICGIENYEQILYISTRIKINIIKLDIHITNVEEYNKLLMSIEFWNKLTVDKILIYQHDTWVFHSNYINFLQYDYIGAPWNSEDSITSKNIGNGGFSLRDRKKMIDILNKYDPDKIELPEVVKINMEKRNSKIIPEDVYFSICSEREGLNVPNRNIASQFSQENVLSNNPFGGHQWWLAYSNINIGINDYIVIDKTIPKIIIQTFREQKLEEYLQKIVDSIKILNNDYQYLYFSDIDCIYFLENNFSPIVLKCYNKIKPGAFKADLFRYCALYIHGGIYLDIKAMPLVSFDEIIDFKLDLNLTRERDVYNRPGYKLWGHEGYIYNAFMACCPKHPIILQLIQICIINILNENYGGDCLSITGPGIFRYIKEDITQYKLFQLDSDCIFINKNERNVIKVSNLEYRKNENSDFSKTYPGLWYNHDVFNH